MTQLTIYLTYFHRDYMLTLSIKMTRNYKFLPFMYFSIEAAKQGPALGVIPVFIPDHPYFSILFVFYHVNVPLSI